MIQETHLVNLDVDEIKPIYKSKWNGKGEPQD